MLSGVALGALTLTVVIGLTMLVALVRSGRRLPSIVWVHLGFALTTLSGWTVYVLQDDPPVLLGWLVFALVLGANTFGDQLMLHAHRARLVKLGRPVPTGARLYFSAARDVLSFERPVVAVHALLAPVVFVCVPLALLGVGD